MSSKVYVVTSGEYSDYHIVAVYQSRKLAEQCAKLGREAEVEEWPIRTGLPKKLANFSCELDKNHNDVESSRNLWEDLVWPNEMNDVNVHDNGYFLRVDGYNPDKVKKVFADRVAKYKAEKEGL